jgi:hypothetical protein
MPWGQGTHLTIHKSHKDIVGIKPSPALQGTAIEALCQLFFPTCLVILQAVY